MPGFKSISENYKKHTKSFFDHLKEAKHLDAENIHELRVDIKRIRSLLKFLEISSGHSFSRKKIMRLISPVYKSAGETRTTSLNRKLISVYRTKSISGFKEHLNSKEKKGEKGFLKELKKFDKKKFKKLHRETLKFFEKENEISVSKNSGKYIRDLFSEIRSYTLGIISDEDFHTIRKILKDVKTMMALLKELNVNKKYLAQQNKVNDIEEKIGKWHDRVILAEELKKFIQRKKTTHTSLPELSGLILKLKAQAELDKKIITVQIRNFLNHLA